VARIHLPQLPTFASAISVAHRPSPAARIIQTHPPAPHIHLPANLRRLVMPLQRNPRIPGCPSSLHRPLLDQQGQALQHVRSRCQPPWISAKDKASRVQTLRVFTRLRRESAKARSDCEPRSAGRSTDGRQIKRLEHWVSIQDQRT
ncbi:hypothetical protein BCR44DRAFT_1426395, partial [Catenaria anguillulae PL171]